MKTSSVYHGFAMHQEDLNKELVHRVRAAAPVETLFLLGLTTAHTRTETLFSDSSVTRNEPTHIYLLVLVQKENDDSLNNIQEKIENNLQHLVLVTAIVISMIQFIHWLAEGHPFAAAVQEKGWLLYQKEEMPLPLPAPVNSEAVQKEAALLFGQTKTKVEEFMAGASLFTLRVQYGMAAFMLHQSAEQLLRAMLILQTGLRVNTHSIDKLSRYATLFCFKLPLIFPRQNEKDGHLLQLLQRAYIEVRYKESYKINLKELETLRERVQALYNVFVQQQW